MGVGHLDPVEFLPIDEIGRLHRRAGNALIGEFDVLRRYFSETIRPRDSGLELKADPHGRLLDDLRRELLFPRPLVTIFRGDQAAAEAAHDVVFGAAEVIGGIEYFEGPVCPDAQDFGALRQCPGPQSRGNAGRAARPQESPAR